MQLNAGVPKNLVYDRTLYLMAGLLLCGLICNLLIRPVAKSKFMNDDELARGKVLQKEHRIGAEADTAARGRFGAVEVLAWAGVGIPFLIGVWIALSKAAALF